MSTGPTMIRLPFSTTIKRWQSNCRPSYERGHRVPNVLQTHPWSGHSTDPGRIFHDTKDSDSSSRQNLTLNRLQGCDGSDGRDGPDVPDGHGDEFYGYTRLLQPNDTSTGHIRDEYREEFGRSSRPHRVNTPGGHAVNRLGWVRVNIGSIRCVWTNFENRSTSGQPSRVTYSTVFG